MGLARRQQRVDDTRAIQRRNRNEIEEAEDHVIEDDALEDREVHAAAHVDREAQGDRAETGDREVCERSGERDRGPRGAATLKPRFVDGYRLPVAEPGEDEEERAKGVEMRQWIEAHPAQQAAGVVAEAMRGEGVHELVDGDPEDDRDDESHEQHDVLFGGIPDQPQDGSGERAVQEGEKQQDEDEEIWPLRSSERAPGATSDHLRSSLWARSDS